MKRAAAVIAQGIDAWAVYDGSHAALCENPRRFGALMLRTTLLALVGSIALSSCGAPDRAPSLEVSWSVHSIGISDDVFVVVEQIAGKFIGSDGGRSRTLGGNPVRILFRDGEVRPLPMPGAAETRAHVSLTFEIIENGAPVFTKKVEVEASPDHGPSLIAISAPAGQRYIISVSCNSIPGLVPTP